MRLAVITGGSRGLGAAICDEYTRDGWAVTELSRSGRGVRVDLSDPGTATEVLATHFGRLSEAAVDEIVVINNAACLGPVGSVTSADVCDIRAHIDVNVAGGILLARAFLARFQDRRCDKTFVNISSGAAHKGHAGWSLYCASKAAMENFVRSVAIEQERERHPVRFINVDPGIMDTQMQAEIRESKVEDFPELERFIGFKNAGHLASPQVVARRIVEVVSTRPEAGTTVRVSR